MKNRVNRVLGVDVGRVIICPVSADGVEDTSFLSGTEQRALETPPCDGAFEAIRDLVQLFEGRVWLVSKCGPRIQALTRRWLAHQRFHEFTGVPPTHVRFCLRRPEKRGHCESIGATHFIDDRLDVLQHLRGAVPNLYWFGHQRTGAASPGWVTPTADFRIARERIFSDVARDAEGKPRARAR
ncbi:MAG TPA: hypothetical protein VFQ35_22330 [Polyangiaceae bacterium]|nr:hypothetical protein [Polyangiaceae bacterium]